MKPHPIDPFSLVVGVALVALGVAGFAGSVDLDGIERSSLVPIALLAVAAAIAASLRRNARNGGLELVDERDEAA